jgi:hypothetical protein
LVRQNMETGFKKDSHQMWLDWKTEREAPND